MISGGENHLTPKFLVFIIDYSFMNGIQCVIANINQDDEYYELLC